MGTPFGDSHSPSTEVAEIVSVSRLQRRDALPARADIRARKARAAVCVVSVALVAVSGHSLSAAESRGKSFPVATTVRVERANGGAGPLYASIGDREERIASVALAAWLINGGQRIVYSGPDGAGGYENEGQSLRIYDVRRGRHRKILSEYFAIDRVTEVSTGTGKTALVVEMRDGGLGASHVAVVDPERGEVFGESKVKLLRCTGETLVLGYYHDEEWEGLIRGDPIRPYKVVEHRLTSLLRRPVLARPPKP